MRVDGKYVCLPRIPRLPAHEAAGHNPDVCFITIRPCGPAAREKMLSFMFDHYRSWTDLTGEPSFSDIPIRGIWRHTKGEVQVIEIDYDLDIGEWEQQYVTSLARWITLRVGAIGQATVGKMSRRALENCGDTYKDDVHTYSVPSLYFNGHERWLVVRRKQWRNRRSPETVGLGTLCDEHGFASQGEARGRQALYHFQSVNRFGLGDLRQMRDWGQEREALIHAELRRLSALWPG